MENIKAQNVNKRNKMLDLSVNSTAQENNIRLDVKEDRKEINKIIENCLPLMKLNKRMTQDCADCIIVHFIDKLEKNG